MCSLDDEQALDPELVGGKAPALVRLRRHLPGAVPPGFVVTTAAYRRFAAENHLGQKLRPCCRTSSRRLDPDQVRSRVQAMRAAVLAGAIPAEVRRGLERLAGEEGLRAVRSSALGEDGEASVAGRFDSLLQVPREELPGAYRAVLAGRWSHRAIHHRLQRGISEGGTLPAEITVQIPSSVQEFVAKNLPTVTLPTIAAQADVQVVSPMIVTVGLAVDPLEGLEIAADLPWIDYSSTVLTVANVTQTASTLVGDQALITGREDAFLLGLRGSYRVLPSLTLALRLEYERNTRPERYTNPVTLDFHKFSLHAGAGWQATDWLALTLEYGHYFLLDRDIRTSVYAHNASPLSLEERGLDKPAPTGRYTGVADRVGLGILLAF